MAAFSVDILSFGRPWLCQAAAVASSVSMRIGSRPSVRGMDTWNRNQGMTSPESGYDEFTGSDVALSVEKLTLPFGIGGKGSICD